MRIAVLALCLAACTSSANPTGIAPVTCSTGSALSYENFGKSFISDNCGSCHDSKQGPSLATLTAIQANIPAILDTAVYTDAMPQDSNMPTQERELLNEWLACGAP